MQLFSNKFNLCILSAEEVVRDYDIKAETTPRGRRTKKQVKDMFRGRKITALAQVSIILIQNGHF